ncbi:MAG: hypothetical protein AAGF97_04835 [Planctomycetota bacterium]
MTATNSMETRVAATISGEDLVPGDFVAVLRRSYEFPSFLWDGCGTTLRPEETVRLQFIPEEAGKPLKVTVVCLPFVYVERADRELKVLDTRQVQLVRLDAKCGEAVWGLLRARVKKRRRRK